MKREEADALLHQKVEEGELISPVLPDGVKNYLIDIDDQFRNFPYTKQSKEAWNIQCTGRITMMRRNPTIDTEARARVNPPEQWLTTRSPKKIHQTRKERRVSRGCLATVSPPDIL